MYRIEEQQAEDAAPEETDSAGGSTKEKEQPQETLAAVLESAKRAMSGATPHASVAATLAGLRKRIGRLSNADQFAAHMAIGSLLTTKCAPVMPPIIVSFACEGLKREQQETSSHSSAMLLKIGCSMHAE